MMEPFAKIVNEQNLLKLLNISKKRSNIDVFRIEALQTEEHVCIYEHTLAYICIYTPFFISNTFTSNAKLKLAKNLAKAKQHPVGKLSLFDFFLLSSSMLSSKTNLRCH